jgi:hypothetical protein
VPTPPAPNPSEADRPHHFPLADLIVARLKVFGAACQSQRVHRPADSSTAIVSAAPAGAAKGPKCPAPVSIPHTVRNGRITWTSRLKVTSVLHELPPPRTGRSGRPRTRGARLGTPADVAALATTTNTWRTTRVRRYGRTDTVQITERACLWYGSFRSQTVRVILVRDNKPRTRGREDRGYGLPLVTTDLESSAEDLVARCRRS